MTKFTAKGDITTSRERVREKEVRWDPVLERFKPTETKEMVTRTPSIFWRIPQEDPFKGPKSEFLRELLLTPQADSGESRLQDIQFEAGLFLNELYPFKETFFEDEYYLPFHGGRLKVTFEVTYNKNLFLTVELNPRQ